MRATMAGVHVELIGCEAMHNAVCFAAFPSSTEQVDCRIETVLETPTYPLLDEAKRIGDWKLLETAENVTACHRSGQLMLRCTPDFTQVRIYLDRNFPNADIVQYLQVQQAVCAYLLLHGGALIHSAGVRVRERAVLLCGRSGVGKSTMAHHLQAISPDVTILCEEMPALGQDGCTVHGTPLCGQDSAFANACAPLAGVVLLRQAPHNRLTAASADEAMFGLLSVMARPPYWPQVGTAATDLATTLCKTFPIVIFDNDGSEDAARMLLSYIETELRDSQ